MAVTIKTKLLRKIEAKGYVVLEELYSTVKEWEFHKEATIDRELRHLVTSEKIEKVTKDGGKHSTVIGYKLPDDNGYHEPTNPQPLRPAYVPVDYRVANNNL